jgi:hypothetical protein
VLRRESADVATLRPHPQNYRTHTAEQLDHLCRSIEEHGLYRNVVVARDWTILAGHGVVEAAKKLQLPAVPVIRLDLAPSDPRALKLLIGDNQIAQLADVDDRQLTDMLKSISDSDLTTLLGTGYDAEQLAALVMVSRPASEIKDHDAAAEWVGLPSTNDQDTPLTVHVFCQTPADRAAFFKAIGATKKHVVVRESKQSIWYPLRTRTPNHAETFDESED